MNQMQFNLGPAAARQPQGGQAAVIERRVPWWQARARLILVPLDGSETARRALPAARLVAQLARASIEVVHISDDRLSSEELLERVGLNREDTAGLAVEQLSGEPSEALARLAEQRRAMLITMTVHPGRARGKRAHPVVDTLLPKAPCPVLLLGGEGARALSFDDPRRILLPLDGTPSAAASIGPALELAERTQAEVDILYVAVHDQPPRQPGSLTAPRYIDQPQYEWQDWAQEFATRFGTALGQYRPTTETQVYLRSGDAAVEIMKLAEERRSDLIVLQWQAPAGSYRGEVVEKVLANAPCPVLILPPQQRERSV